VAGPLQRLMSWLMEEPPASPFEIADALRQHAEECLRLARRAESPAMAAELVIMAASLHERATRLEATSSWPQSPGAVTHLTA